MQHFTITHDDDTLRIDKWCKLHLPHLSFGLVQKACRTGMIKVAGRKCTSDYRLKEGEVLHIAESLVRPAEGSVTSAPLPRPSSKAVAEETRRMVLFQDAYCIALNKPAGLAAQGGSGISDSIDSRLGCLVEAGQERPRLVHRIDRDTSGILLLGKTRAATAELAEAFRAKSAQKIYWALVTGIPDQPIGTIDVKLAKRNAGSGLEKMSVVQDDEEGEHALTHFRVIEVNTRHDISWVECMPVTGRTHQLRVHLQAIGHPIYGDGKYGGKAAFHPHLNLAKQLHLHARELRLTAPRPYRFKAPVPPHFADALELLGFPRDDMGVSLLELF
jgi:23S rRNA pseudouridine955/2504/2580 synthase